MKYLKLSLRYTFKSILFFIAFILLYLLLAWLLPQIKVNTWYKPQEKGVEIFIASNGVHTDFVVPTKHDLKDWRKEFNPNEFESVDTTFEYVSLAILNASKACVTLRGKNFVTPDEIKFVAPHLIKHRVIITPEKEMKGITTNEVVNKMIEKIELPR